jgi:hypothetical protein
MQVRATDHQQNLIFRLAQVPSNRLIRLPTLRLLTCLLQPLMTQHPTDRTGRGAVVQPSL